MKQKNTFLSENLNFILFVFLAIFTCLSVYNIFYSHGVFVDMLEHLSASFFVYEGLLPYKDFFEHHNPLLWLMLAPITGLLKGNLIIIPLVRFLAVAGYFFCIYMSYKINEKFLFGKKAALYSTILLIAVPIWYDIMNIRPDIFMMLCFLGAIYLFYSYLEKRKIFKLVMCYFLLSVSFLFLQKIIFMIFGFGLVNLYLLYKKKLPFKDFFISAIFGSIPLILFLIYSVYNGFFFDWFYYNFTFNSYLTEYYDNTMKISRVLSFLIYVSFAIILKKYSNSFKSMVIFVPLCCGFISLIFFAPYYHYTIPYFLLASVYFGKFCLDVKIFKYTFTTICFLLITLTGILNNYPNEMDRIAYQKDLSLIEYINNNIPEKSFAPLTEYPYAIFKKPFNYHWFGFFNASIIDILYTPNHYFDFNEHLKQTKPTYLIYPQRDSAVALPENILMFKSLKIGKRNNKIINKLAEHPQLRSKIIPVNYDYWNVDDKWIDEHYTKINDLGIYKRK